MSCSHHRTATRNSSEKTCLGPRRQSRALAFLPAKAPPTGLLRTSGPSKRAPAQQFPRTPKRLCSLRRRVRSRRRRRNISTCEKSSRRLPSTWRQRSERSRSSTSKDHWGHYYFYLLNRRSTTSRSEGVLRSVREVLGFLLRSQASDRRSRTPLTSCCMQYFDGGPVRRQRPPCNVVPPGPPAREHQGSRAITTASHSRDWGGFLAQFAATLRRLRGWRPPY